MMSFYFLNESMRREQNHAHSLRESFSVASENQSSTIPDSSYPVKIRKESWQHFENPSRIVKEFIFDDVGQQRFFVSEIMKSLDIHNHNIEISIRSDSVIISTRTDVYDDVTELDLEIAKTSDEIYEDALFVVVINEPAF